MPLLKKIQGLCRAVLLWRTRDLALDEMRQALDEHKATVAHVGD